MQGPVAGSQKDMFPDSVQPIWWPNPQIVYGASDPGPAWSDNDDSSYTELQRIASVEIAISSNFAWCSVGTTSSPTELSWSGRMSGLASNTAGLPGVQFVLVDYNENGDLSQNLQIPAVANIPVDGVVRDYAGTITTDDLPWWATWDDVLNVLHSPRGAVWVWANGSPPESTGDDDRTMIVRIHKLIFDLDDIIVVPLPVKAISGTADYSRRAFKARGRG